MLFCTFWSSSSMSDRRSCILSRKFSTIFSRTYPPGGECANTKGVQLSMATSKWRREGVPRLPRNNAFRVWTMMAPFQIMPPISVADPATHVGAASTRCQPGVRPAETLFQEQERADKSDLPPLPSDAFRSYGHVAHKIMVKLCRASAFAFGK